MAGMYYLYNLKQNFQGDGRIGVTQVGDVLRALGESPTEAEVQKYCSHWTEPGNYTCSFETADETYMNLKPDLIFSSYMVNDFIIFSCPNNKPLRFLFEPFRLHTAAEVTVLKNKLGFSFFSISIN